MKKFLLFFALLLPMAIWAQQINVNPETLPDFSYIENEVPLEENTFVVSATGLIDTIGTDTIVITASERFEISTQTGEGFETTLRLFADADGTVDTTTIYVRMIAGLPAGSYDYTIVVSSQRGFAQDAYVHCHGTVVMPTLPTPNFSLPSNTYTGEQQVSITCDVEDATIHYRHDPSEEWIDYASPILVDRDMIICAKATKEGYYDSEEFCADYAIEYTITATTTDPDYGEVIGGGNNYHWGQDCTVVALANTNYTFDNWTENGEIISTDTAFTFSCNGNRDLVAHFRLVALPSIVGEITNPVAICSGNPLELMAPVVILSDNEEWQISADTTFELYSVYDGQILDATYNDWQLRYAASNEAGVSYSNRVIITVHPVLNENEILEIVGKKCGDNVEHILVYPKSGYQYQWYRDNEPIDTTQYIHSANGLKNGTYRVEIGWARNSGGQLLCPVSSAEYEVGSANRLVYPNPVHVNAGIIVTNESDGCALFSVYSIDGRLVHQQMVNSGKSTIQIGLSKGIYMSSLSSENSTITEKIIIQ